MGQVRETRFRIHRFRVFSHGNLQVVVEAGAGVNAAIPPLLALASSNLAPDLVQKLLSACRLQNEKYDSAIFLVIAKMQPNSRAYFELIASELSKADFSWSRRILRSAPFATGVEQGQDADVQVLIDFLHHNTFASKSSPLLKDASEYFASELRISRLSSENLDQLSDILRNARRLGREFWLTGPVLSFKQGSFRFAKWYPVYAQIKRDKAISVILNDAMPPTDVAQAAMLLTMFQSKDYDSQGLEPVSNLDELANAISRRLKTLIADPAQLHLTLEVDGSYTDLAFPNMRKGLPILNQEWSVSTSRK